MTELALNILDIVQNSVRAEATEIRIGICESLAGDRMEITVCDNGKGMDESLLATADDPFTTTRTTRRTGMGLPLLKHHARLTGGDMAISSETGKGTTVKAWFGLKHVDRQPLGDISGIVTILISANPGIEFIYEHKTDSGSYRFSTAEAREVLETEKFNDYGLLKDIRMMINENLSSISVSDQDRKNYYI